MVKRARASLTITEIAGFHLSRLPAPTAGFAPDEEAYAQEARESDTILDALDAEKRRLHELFDGIDMPDDEVGDPIYPDFLKQTLEENPTQVDEQSPLRRKAREIPFLHRCVDVAQVMEKVEKIAQRILTKKFEDETPIDTETEEFQNARAAVKNALLLRLHDNRLVADNHGLIRVDFGRLPESPKRVSTRQVRKLIRKISVKKLNQRNYTDEQACIEFFNGLVAHENRITTVEERRRFLDKDMPDCLERATELYKEITRRVQKAQEEFHIEGEQITIDLAEENEYRDIVQLLSAVVNQSLAPEAIEETGIEALSEAQTLANLNYLFYLVRKHPYYQQALTQERKFRKQVVENLFLEKMGRTEWEKVHVDREGNILPSEEGAFGHQRIGLRSLNVDEFKTLGPQRVFFEGIRRKKAKAIVKKLLLNPHYEMEKDIFDYLGGRIFLWDISTKDLQDPERGPPIKEDLNALAEKIGKSTGARLRFKRREQLAKGEFCIEDKIDENGQNDKSFAFPALKVYGISKEGHPFEFQIVLKDGYTSSKSKGSPGHEEFYEMEKDFRLTKLLFPKQIFPTINEVAGQGQRALQAKKRAWKATHSEVAA